MSGVELMPIYLIAEDSPHDVTTSEYIVGVPLRELLSRLGPGEHLYLVDLTQPAAARGTIELVRLV